MVEVVKEYVHKRIDLVKLEATEKTALVAGNIVTIILLCVFGIFFIILLNIGLSCLLGQYLGNYAYGFLIVAGIYLLFVIIVLLAGKGIKNSVANLLIKAIG